MKCPYCSKPKQEVRSGTRTWYECRDPYCHNLIKPGKYMSIKTGEDEIYNKGINIVWNSLNDVEFISNDRWLQLKPRQARLKGSG